MTSLLVGFGTLVAVIGLGWVAGRVRVLGDGASEVLSRLSYFVATPALLLLALAEADPGVLVSPALVATAGSAVLRGLLYAVIARWRWRSRPAELATGSRVFRERGAGRRGGAVGGAMTDVVLIGAGIMSATLRTLIREWRPTGG